MGRLRLVLGDPDEAYLESLAGFLMSNYSSWVQLITFTEKEQLETFAGSPDRKADILLINPSIWNDSLQGNNAGVPIALLEERTAGWQGKYGVFKYQHGEKLIHEVLSIYAGENSPEALSIKGSSTTRLVAFFSCCGGSGSTSLSVNTAIMACQAGLSSFYLNLEEIPSTSVFFDCNQPKGLSDILYHLRRKDGSLSLKLEAARVTDARSGVHFLAPCDHGLEMGEVVPAELKELLRCLRLLSRYDLVAVDLAAGLNVRNAAVLEECDQVLLVVREDQMCRERTDRLLRDLEKLSGKTGCDIREKIQVVVNRTASPPTKGLTGKYCGLPIAAGLPAIHRLPPGQVIGPSLECCRDFLHEVGDLAHRMTASREETIHAL